jgi:metallo-beta-lactamase class B
MRGAMPCSTHIADDLTKTFRTLKSLPCDVLLAPHGSMFGLPEKAHRQAAGEKPNPFVDPEGYRSFTARSEQVFRQQLEHDQRGTATRPKSVP